MVCMWVSDDESYFRRESIGNVPDGSSGGSNNLVAAKVNWLSAREFRPINPLFSSGLSLGPGS